MTEHYHYVLAAGSAGAPPVYALNDPFLFSTNVPAAQQMMPFAKWLAAQPGHPTRAAYPIVDDPFADPPVTTAEKYLRQHGVQTVYANFKKPYSATIGTRGLEAAAEVVARTHPDIVFLGSIAVGTVQAFMTVLQHMNPPPKYFIASSGPDQGTSFLSAVGTGAAVGAMVPNGWFGGFPNALSHVMVQDYIAKYGGTAADINADVAESYSAGEVEAAAVQATGSLNQQNAHRTACTDHGADGAGAGQVRRQRERTLLHRAFGADLPVAAGPGRRGRAAVRPGAAERRSAARASSPGPADRHPGLAGTESAELTWEPSCEPSPTACSKAVSMA